MKIHNLPNPMPIVARRIPLPELLIDKYDGTSTLGSFDPNGYNLLDLTGNIWGDSAIDNQDLADDAVTSEKIKDGEVMTEDLSDDAVTNDKNWRRFRAGEVLSSRTGQPMRIEPGGTGSTDVTCNEGKIVIGRGFENEFENQPSICPPQ